MKNTIIIFLAVCLAAALYYLFILIRRNKELLQENSDINKMLSDYAAKFIDTQKECESLKEAFGETKKMQDEIRSLHEKSRSLKHDMKNHMLVLLSFLNEQKYDDAIKYVGNITDKLNKMYSYIHVGNSLLNYILNTKLSAACDKGIDVKADIHNLPFDYMESMDFSALMSNLLDNAINAAEKSSTKTIQLSIYQKNGCDVISIRNSIDSSVLRINPELRTTSIGEGHGFGMPQIRSIIEKYDGMLDIFEEEGFFVINAVYPR